MGECFMKMPVPKGAANDPLQQYNLWYSVGMAECRYFRKTLLMASVLLPTCSFS
jgi:hypothetical protein